MEYIIMISGGSNPKCILRRVNFSNHMSYKRHFGKAWLNWLAVFVDKQRYEQARSSGRFSHSYHGNFEVIQKYDPAVTPYSF